MRLHMALLAGKLTHFSVRLFRLGSGSNIPGYVAHRIDPLILAKLVGDKQGIVVTGTNGKTTTTNIIAQIMQANGSMFAHNNLGANMLGGIVTSVLQRTDIFSRKFGADGFLFETDEGTVPRLLRIISPNVLVVTNLFRDQLDRFGEILQLRDLLSASLEFLKPGARIVLNADDPLVASLTFNSALKPVYFGLDAGPITSETHRAAAADIANCIRCEAPLQYSARFFSHLGHFHCNRCGFRRPAPQVAAANIKLGSDRTVYTLRHDRRYAEVRLPFGGLYNVYNSLAAVAAAQSLGVPPDAVIRVVAGARPVFGRIESLDIRGRRCCIILVKNPVGFNQVIQMINNDDRAGGLVIYINDYKADGEDISWLWDVNFEKLRDIPSIASGKRGADMALRLRYAGKQGSHVVEDIGAATELAVTQFAPGKTIYLLPTYSALIQLKGYLAKRGYVADVWGQRR